MLLSSFSLGLFIEFVVTPVTEFPTLLLSHSRSCNRELILYLHEYHILNPRNLSQDGLPLHKVIFQASA